MGSTLLNSRLYLTPNTISKPLNFSSKHPHTRLLPPTRAQDAEEFDITYDRSGYLYRLHRRTLEARTELINMLKQPAAKNLLPPVAAVTFAAPRVGDRAYSEAFRFRSVMDPMTVVEPKSPFGNGHLGHAGILWRNQLRCGQHWVSYMPAMSQTREVDKVQGKSKVGGGASSRASMLRVVNAPDLVPNLPVTLPTPFCRCVACKPHQHRQRRGGTNSRILGAFSLCCLDGLQ